MTRYVCKCTHTHMHEDINIYMNIYLYIFMYMKKNAQPIMSHLAEVKQRSEDAHDKVCMYMHTHAYA